LATSPEVRWIHRGGEIGLWERLELWLSKVALKGGERGEEIEKM
jgi:hypothetical protein